MDKRIGALRGHLIVSCQALPEEPLHSAFIMSRMAKAAAEGGAAGIRANTGSEIQKIRATVSLPIIGIVKKEYPDSPVYITPTKTEVEELRDVHPEIIAVDATDRPRPNGKTLDEFFLEMKSCYPGQLWMADCSTLDEAVHADQLGFDFIGTTLVGYTEASRELRIDTDDFALLREILKKVSHPVIAEGNIDTPEKARRVIELGAFCVVVGSAITRPQWITRNFVQALPTGHLDG